MLWTDLLTTKALTVSDENYLRAVEETKKGEILYPPTDKIFSAMKMTPPEKTKVVIVGQDPYHGPGQANGLSFSVNPDKKLPPSLQNIYKELSDDLGVCPPTTGDLSGWASQGVLLLNTILTVYAHQPASCTDWGWEVLTGDILRAASTLPQPVVFILWGMKAKAFAENALSDITHDPNKLILTSPHPSPYSAKSGFFGSKPFSKTNNFLVKRGATPINWSK